MKINRNKKYRSKTCTICKETFGSMGNPKYCYTCKDKLIANKHKKETAKERVATMKSIYKGL